MLCFFSAIASSAPIWQFTGMTPCNAFYRVTSSVYIDTSAECGLTILASWKAIDNVTKTGNAYFFYIIILDTEFTVKYFILHFFKPNVFVTRSWCKFNVIIVCYTL